MSNHPKRVLCIADIHGNKERLKKLLASEVYASVDHRVYLGDYLDGCDNDSIGTAELILKEAKRADVTLLRGNHERDQAAFLKQFMDHQAGKAAAPKAPKKKSRLDTLLQLHQFWNNTRDHAADGHDPFRTLVLAIINAYDASPYFVRIGKAFFAHGGYHPAMMRARSYHERTELVKGVYTCELRETEVPHVLLGIRLLRPAARYDGLRTAPKGYKVYVGHHYGRANRNTPWEESGITCLDTGCGKGADLPLTAAEIDATTGEVIALHTF